MQKKEGVKEIASNRKAFHDYFVLERFEAGIELFGTEVKSIRAGQVNMKDCFCTVMLSMQRTGGSAAGPVVPEYFMTRTERTDV